jgi:hypothetical protein
MRNSVVRGVTALTGTFVLGLAASAFAADGTVQFEQGIQPAVTFNGSVGGGEFGAFGFSNPSILAPISTPVKVNDTVNGINGFQFQTFCVEPGTHIAFHTQLDYTVSTTVQLADGSTRPLNAATAYLFTKFWNNTPFTSLYAYTPLGSARSASAANMQLAIWYTEGVSSYKAGIVSDYIDEAIAATTAGGSWATTYGTTFPGNLGNVRALNLAQGADLQQDVLVLVGPTTRGGDPNIRLTKTVDPAIADPFQAVTYSYLVENIGAVDLDNVIVTDDNGTPGDPTDDFQLGPVSIPAGGSYTFGKTIVPPILDLCATINNVPDTYAGTLVTTVLPNGDVKVTYIQSETHTNDNRYGTGATAATGWPNGHKFGDLTGSDECQFRFKDKNGVVVLEFKEDYITAASSATFPNGTVNYPSGYGTLGATGGDGGMIVGSSANVLTCTTSLTDNLKLPQFQSGFFINSPPETAPYSGVSIPAGWNYKDSYTVVIKGSVFGAAGFGSVVIAGQHNSPPKTGSTNLLTPVPCDTTVVNTAVVTATAVGSGLTVTASDDASLLIDSGSDGGGGNTVLATITKFDKHKVNIALKNTGTTTATIGTLKLDWPAGNNGLKNIKKGAAVLFDTLTPPTTVTVSTWKGKLGDRQIPKGGTLTLTFEFESNANTTKTNYHLSVDFGGGLVVLLP